MKWTVGKKLVSGFGIAVAIFLIVATVCYRSTGKLIETAEWVAHTHEVLGELDAVVQSVTDAETGQRGYLLTADNAYLEPYNASISQVDKHVKQVTFLTRDNPKQQERCATLDSLAKLRLASLKKVVDELNKNGLDAARQIVLTGEGRNEMLNIRTLIADMKTDENTLLKERSEDAAASAVAAKLTIVVGSIGTVIAVSVVTFLLTRSIARPLQSVQFVATQIAAGNLEVQIESLRRNDEIGALIDAFGRMAEWLKGMAGVADKIAGGDLQIKVKPQSDKDKLGNAFATMIQNLQQLTTEIADGVNILSTSANQISTSSVELASSASETATAVAQTTTTAEEVRQTAHIASQKSKSVSDNAQKAVQTAEAGRQATESTVEGIQRIRQQIESIADSMVRLSEQSQAIGQIVATVEDLAAQSNILAVNASIEAAKAGDHGKGFAVVAQEVRSLAEQSKLATNEVRTILNDIQKATHAAVMATEQGNKAADVEVRRAEAAGHSIQVLSTSVDEAAQAATQIAASSQQQLIGMDQVAAAIGSVRTASSQNVASAKQLESAALSLKELGHTLKTTVERFKR